jgi:HD-GYP domain-containing protein (c-di-GMP phosphodiesterase class II)
MEGDRAKILLVRDDREDHRHFRERLAESPRVAFEIALVANYDGGLAMGQSGRHEIALVDDRPGVRVGLGFIREAVARGCRSPFVLRAEHDDVVDAAALGAGVVASLVNGQFDVKIMARSSRLGTRRGQRGPALDVTERTEVQRENRALESELRRRLGRMAALRRIDVAINAGHDLGRTLDVVVGEVVEQLQVDAADVLVCDPKSSSLECAAHRGFRTTAMPQARLALERSVAGQVALERRPQHLTDLTQSPRPFARAAALHEEGFLAYSAVPLVAKGHVRGVLEVFHRGPLEPGPEWFDFLGALADQTAIALDNAALLDGLKRSNAELAAAYDATIEGWSHALDLRDRETEGHSRRVTDMTVQLARSMGVPEEGLVQIRRGALLHDIGRWASPMSSCSSPASSPRTSGRSCAGTRRWPSRCSGRSNSSGRRWTYRTATTSGGTAPAIRAG